MDYKERDYKFEVAMAREYGGVDAHTRRLRPISSKKTKPNSKTRARSKAARKMRRKQRG